MPKHNSFRKHRSPKTSRKHRSPKTSRKHRSPKQRVSSHYKMKGMGVLMNLYGGALDELEKQLAQMNAQRKDIKSQISAEKSAARREKLLKIQAAIDQKMHNIKEKTKHLLKGVADTTKKAARSLSSGIKKGWAKMTSGIKEGIADYKEKQGLKKYYDIQRQRAELARKQEKQFRKLSPSAYKALSITSGSETSSPSPSPYLKEFGSLSTTDSESIDSNSTDQHSI